MSRAKIELVERCEFRVVWSSVVDDELLVAFACSGRRLRNDEVLVEADTRRRFRVRWPFKLGGGPPAAGEQNCALVAECGPAYKLVNGAILVPEDELQEA